MPRSHSSPTARWKKNMHHIALAAAAASSLSLTACKSHEDASPRRVEIACPSQTMTRVLDASCATDGSSMDAQQAVVCARAEVALNGFTTGHETDARLTLEDVIELDNECETLKARYGTLDPDPAAVCPDKNGWIVAFTERRHRGLARIFVVSTRGVGVQHDERVLSTLLSDPSCRTLSGSAGGKK